MKHIEFPDFGRYISYKLQQILHSQVEYNPATHISAQTV